MKNVNFKKYDLIAIDWDDFGNMLRDNGVPLNYLDADMGVLHIDFDENKMSWDEYEIKEKEIIKTLFGCNNYEIFVSDGDQNISCSEVMIILNYKGE